MDGHFGRLCHLVPAALSADHHRVRCTGQHHRTAVPHPPLCDRCCVLHICSGRAGAEGLDASAGPVWARSALSNSAPIISSTGDENSPDFPFSLPRLQLKLLSLIFLGLSLAMAVNWTVHGTHFNPRFRAARAAGAGVFFYASLALVIRIHHENRHVFVDTLALALGSPIAGAVAAAISFALWRRDTRAAAGILAETRAAQRIDPGISAAALRIDFQFGSIEQVHRLAAVLARTAMTSRLCPPDISFAVEAIFLSGALVACVAHISASPMPSAVPLCASRLSLQSTNLARSPPPPGPPSLPTHLSLLGFCRHPPVPGIRPPPRPVRSIRHGPCRGCPVAGRGAWRGGQGRQRRPAARRGARAAIRDCGGGAGEELAPNLVRCENPLEEDSPLTTEPLPAFPYSAHARPFPPLLLCILSCCLWALISSLLILSLPLAFSLYHSCRSERYLVFSADTELKEISQRDAASEESAMDLQVRDRIHTTDIHGRTSCRMRHSRKATQLL